MTCVKQITCHHLQHWPQVIVYFTNCLVKNLSNYMIQYLPPICKALEAQNNLTKYFHSHLPLGSPYNQAFTKIKTFKTIFDLSVMTGIQVLSKCQLTCLCRTWTKAYMTVFIPKLMPCNHATMPFQIWFTMHNNYWLLSLFRDICTS